MTMTLKGLEVIIIQIYKAAYSRTGCARNEKVSEMCCFCRTNRSTKYRKHLLSQRRAAGSFELVRGSSGVEYAQKAL